MECYVQFWAPPCMEDIAVLSPAEGHQDHKEPTVNDLQREAEKDLLAVSHYQTGSYSEKADFSQKCAVIRTRGNDLK